MDNNIVLIGFMGCGKTSVGKRLAEKMGFEFLDTDEYIKKKKTGKFLIYLPRKEKNILEMLKLILSKNSYIWQRGQL